MQTTTYATTTLALISILVTASCDDDAGGSDSPVPGGQGGTAGATSSHSGGAPSSNGGTGGTGGGGASSDGGAGGAGGTAPSCHSGLEQATAACTACQDEHCCKTATLAAEDPGVWTKSAAKICREANCWQECGVGEPECGGIQPTPASCTDELYAACCGEVKGCAESDDCTALVYICVDDKGCEDLACFNECAKAYPDGLPLFDAFVGCFNDVTCP